jgi:hypothetical protein
MNWKSWMGVLTAALLLIVMMGCDEGINDWSSSAKVSGYVFADPAHTVPLPGVQVIVEGDPAADHPYEGPDRWFVTDQDGYFEGYVFLGYSQDDTNYVYLGDLDVAYFKDLWSFRWGGGITVGPGSDFTLPPVDTVNFKNAGGE